MIPLVGFLPDADPTTPGVVVDCLNAIPSAKGIKAAPSLVATTIDALAATCLGSAVLFKLDGTSRVFAGTATKLYEISSTSWSDVSRVGDYTTGDIRWRFGIMGNTALATNKSDLLQYSTTGDFADVAGAPKAQYMDVAAGFVMLAGVDLGGGAGFESDRWICSAYQDYSDWTPATTTQCTTGRIVDAPGPFTGVRALGAQFVAYKDKSVFLGEYVSAPDVWRWTRIPGEIGCPNHDAVVSISTAHYFIGQENIYAFDGNAITPIGTGINEWFFANLNSTYRYLITGMHERKKTRIWWFFPKGTSTTLNAAIVYNYTTQKWGYVEIDIECPVEYVSGGVTFDGLGAIAATYEDFPNVSYDSPFWTASQTLPAVFDTTHALVTMTGVSSGCTIKLGIVGDDSTRSVVTRVKPRFTLTPTAGSMTNYSSETDGVTMTSQSTSTMNNGKFDVLHSARWHQFQFVYTGDCEVIGTTFTSSQDGAE